MLRLEITGDTPRDFEMQIVELAKALMGRQTEKSVEDLLEELRSKLADQGMTVNVVARKGQEQTKVKAEAEQPEEEEQKEEAAPRRKRGGQPKTSKDDAAADLGTETAAARKARCVAKLQDLFANGKKAEVLKILADHGGGAKTFAAVDEAKFEPISEALEAL